MGRQIVLAASRSESSEYLRSTWRQMLLATLPSNYLRLVNTDPLLDNETRADLQALYVPNGLRVIESLLLGRFAPGDIAVCYPDQLPQFVGPETRVVGLHAHNPLGITFATGEGEDCALDLFERAVRGGPLPRKVPARSPDPSVIPRLRHRSTFGVVEWRQGRSAAARLLSPRPTPCHARLRPRLPALLHSPAPRRQPAARPHPRHRAGAGDRGRRYHSGHHHRRPRCCARPGARLAAGHHVNC
ncbi:MAG TPA: hypothetical protein VIE13_11915 [Terriglobales bacterium]|jgi:hypothetical protein